MTLPRRRRPVRKAAPAAGSRSSAPDSFERRVLTVVSRVPPGRVTTYGDVAMMAGRPGAARAVGNILARADRPGLPYHRVIAAGGGLGGYSDLAIKRALLAAEGILVGPRRVREFARLRWLGRVRP
jgi:methylated-DNA-protein-cysteine methyltransferase related protein